MKTTIMVLELLRIGEPSGLGYITPLSVAEEIIKRTELPMPIFIEFDQRKPIGKIISLYLSDGDDGSKKLMANCEFQGKPGKEMGLAATGRSKTKIIDKQTKTEILREFVLLSASLTKSKA